MASLRVPVVYGNTGTSATDPDVEITIPAGTMAGDYVFVHAHNGNSTATLSITSGFVTASNGGPVLIAALSVQQLFVQVAPGTSGQISTIAGTTVTVTATVADRLSVSLAVVKDASSYAAATAMAATASSNNWGLQGITPASANSFLVGFAGLRTAAVAPPITTTYPADWVSGGDMNWTPNTSGAHTSTWVGTRSISGGAGVAVAAVNDGTTPTITNRQSAFVLALAPKAVANAGTDQNDIAPGATVNLSGTHSDASTITDRIWTQISGPSVTISGTGANRTYVAPSLSTPSTLVFGYQVVSSDAGTSEVDTVTHTIDATPPVSNQNVVVNGETLTVVSRSVAVGGVLVEIQNSIAIPPVDPEEPPVEGALKFFSGFPGGGGQASNDVSIFDEDQFIAGTDTGGVRISRDGTATSLIHTSGFDNLRSRQTDGAKWSRIEQGRAFITCGDGTSGKGGVYVCEDADTESPTKWKRLDGIVSGSSQLLFNGGNNNSLAAPTSGSPSYPRHYGRNIEIDESSIPGYTLIHVATTNDGAQRIKMRNSDQVAVEQIRYSGTEGEYVRCLSMPTFAPNAAENIYSRIIISIYHRSTPKRPLLCTNANDGTTNESETPPTLSTSTITNAPLNTEAIGYVKSNTPGAVATTVFTAEGYVGMSTNAHSASAGSITLTQSTTGPEASKRWISVGTTAIDATDQHVILVGTFSGLKISANVVNTVWRGVVSATASNPASSIVWTALAGSSYWSEQIMNRGGTDNNWWLGGSNTPGISTSAAVSSFATSADGKRMYAVARGNSYVSDDYGLHWYASRIFGSADHSSVRYFLYYDSPKTFVTTCGDWPLGGSLDDFATEPHGMLKKQINTNTTWEDPKTGEVFIGGCPIIESAPETTEASAPGSSVHCTLWGLPFSHLSLTSTEPLAVMIDYNLEHGADSVIGLPMCGITVYGNAGAGTTRAIVAGCGGGKGMWYTKNDGTTWTKILASSGTTHPFSTMGGFENGQMFWDKDRNLIYIMDRGVGRVWRCSVSTDGTISTAVSIFGDTWTYGAADDGTGYIDIDTINDRLWVATANGVWYIPTASTVASVTGTGNATKMPTDTQYPGEIFGPMCFLPASGKVLAITMGLDGTQNQNYNPSRNEADGGRALLISNPTLDASWDRATAEDIAVTRDRGFRLGYTAPHGLARNVTGTSVAVTMQGNGCGIWRF